LKKAIYKILVLIKRLLLFPKQAITLYHSGKQLGNNVQLKMDVALLLAFQYDNEFARKDVIIRYKALKDKFFNSDEHGFALYEKLMSERYKEKPFKNKIEDSLDGLFNNMKVNGFDDNYPIPVNSEFRLLDGSHRLAAALANGIQEVPVSVLTTKKKVCFTTNLLQQYNFNEAELSSINDTETKLFLDLGVYFPVIIWPTASQFVDDIENDLGYETKFRFNLELSEAKFETFVRAIYEIDHIADWKVDKKLDAMTMTQNKVSVIFIDFQSPDYRKKKDNCALISKKGEVLKQHIRSKYKSKIENYIYDIIMHTGDNYIHNKKIVEITKTYIND